MGDVEISGKVDVFQYWPNGSSDVDTVRFLPDLTTATYHSDNPSVNVQTFFERGGTFQPDDNNPGEERFKGILRTAGGISLSVRLQGIDAPETHYSPNFREGMFDGDYATWIAKHLVQKRSHRQPYGKLCTDFFANDLRKLLGIGPFDPKAPEPPVDAKVRILADSINSAADVYGRIVGYVTLTRNGQDVVLNDFALENGYAFCSFYGSMSIEEMRRLAGLYDAHPTGGNPKSKLRKSVSGHLRDFEPELWTTRSMRDTDRDDNGDDFPAKCFDPKLFRRCVDWVGRKQVLNENIHLLDYMRANEEEVVLMADFATASGDWAKARKLAMGAFIGPDGAIRYKPGEVIFEARPVVMVDKQRVPLPQSFLIPYP